MERLLGLFILGIPPLNDLSPFHLLGSVTAKYTRFLRFDDPLNGLSQYIGIDPFEWRCKKRFRSLYQKLRTQSYFQISNNLPKICILSVYSKVCRRL